MMEEYLKNRSAVFNEASGFSCPETCERYGCKEPDLHITISLVDLVALARASELKVSEIFRNHCKIGFDPLSEREPWVGRVSMELRKPCVFLKGKKCGVYAGRPIACALFPEAFFVLEDGERALSEDIFRRFPCVQKRASVSPRRREVLHELLRLFVQESFLSDFFLFGISPLMIDLKNTAGEGLRDLEVSEEGVVKLPMERLEEMVSKNIHGSPIWSEWERKLLRLDQPEGVEEFWKMKPWTDQIMEATSRIPVNIACQFVEGSLESLRFFR